MTKFDHEVCLLVQDVTDCAYTTMRAVEVTEKAISNVKNNVQATFKNFTEGDPNILNTSFYDSREASIFFYPDATINNRTFYGLFKAPEVFETICNSLISPPQSCTKFIKQIHQTRVQEEGDNTWKTILIVLLVMTGGFLVALFVYTRIIRREVNQQLSV